MTGLLGQDRIVHFLGRVAQIVKDLTLPIVLVLLGVYFQVRQKERDNELQQKQRDAEEARQREQKIRDERQEVRQNILPLVMKLAEVHYMPIVRSARLLIGDYRSFKAGIANSSFDKVFFDVMFFFKQMDYLRQEKGQIFFQDKTAERVASEAWFLIREKFLAVLTDQQVGAAMKVIEVKDGFSEFLPKEAKFSQARKNLENWVNQENDEFWRYLKLIDLIQAVFRFEANRPFLEHWYASKSEKASFEIGKNLDLPQKPLSDSSKQTIESLRATLPDYLKEIT